MTQHSQTDLSDDDILLTTEQIYRRDLRAFVIADRERRQEEEKELVQRAKSGGKPERDALVLHLLPIVDRFALRRAAACCSPRIEYLDLVQDGSEAMFSYLDKALTREADHVIPYLINVAYNSIRNRTDRYLSPIETPREMEPILVASLDAAVHLDREDCTLLDTIADSSFGVVPQQSERDKNAALDTAIRALPEKERTLIVRHYGLYLNSAEPIGEVLRSSGNPGRNDLLTRALTRLCVKLKDAYPQYCSPTRKGHTGGASSLPSKPLTEQQQQRLQEAEQRLTTQNLPITAENLRREAHVDGHAAQRYRRELRAQDPQMSHEERLNRVVQEMQAQGESITVSALALHAQVDVRVARLYLRMLDNQAVRSRVRSDRPASERLQEAYAHLIAQGEKITGDRLQQTAHVGHNDALSFLRSMCSDNQAVRSRVCSDRPASERLQEAYAHLIAQGEKITRDRLQQTAHVGGHAAGTFLRSMREPQLMGHAETARADVGQEVYA